MLVCSEYFQRCRETLRRENIPAVALHSRCLLKTMCYTKGPPWVGSGDRELPNPAPGDCLVAQHAVKGYEACLDTG